MQKYAFFFIRTRNACSFNNRPSPPLLQYARISAPQITSPLSNGKKKREIGLPIGNPTSLNQILLFSVQEYAKHYLILGSSRPKFFLRSTILSRKPIIRAATPRQASITKGQV